MTGIFPHTSTSHIAPAVKMSNTSLISQRPHNWYDWYVHTSDLRLKPWILLETVQPRGHTITHRSRFEMSVGADVKHRHHTTSKPALYASWNAEDDDKHCPDGQTHRSCSTSRFVGDDAHHATCRPAHMLHIAPHLLETTLNIYVR